MIKATLLNADQVRNHFLKLGEDIAKTAGNSVRKWTEAGRMYAKSKTPIDKGILVNSINHTVNTQDNTSTGLIYVTPVGRGKSWNTETLAWNMHNKTGYRPHWGINGGTPYFFTATKEMLEKQLPNSLRVEIQGLLKK